MTAVGVLHPGMMGASLGGCLAAADHRALWASEGRSNETAARAASTGFEDAGGLVSLVERSEVLVSVCPPHAAVAVARSVSALGFEGMYIDANAVAPATARQIAEIFPAGAKVVDGGIVGPPATSADTTRLFLSGTSAEDAARLFAGSFLEPVVVDEEVGSASATKAAFATWTKVSSALLLSVESYAAEEGVLDVLLTEWDRRFPDLRERLRLTRSATQPKAWRFVGEMEQLAAAMADVDLPAGFHEGAAEIYRRQAEAD